jgi:hypothetical protein
MFFYLSFMGLQQSLVMVLRLPATIFTGGKTMNTPELNVHIKPMTAQISMIQPPTGTRHRLVTVITDVTEEAQLAHRIWSIAQARNLEVLLLGICTTSSEEQKTNRQLTTIAAFLRVGNVPVQTAVIHRGNWLAELRQNLDPDDYLACCDEDDRRNHHGPLSDVLAQALGCSVLDLSETQTLHMTKTNHLKQAGAWLCSLLTIAGFLVLQARIVVAMNNGMQTVIFLLLLLPEVGLILFWNHLFS